MAIGDKTRKILWGRSGNRCTICRQRLVLDETSVDAESVVGDECHINSAAPNGPRHVGSIERDGIDELGNLILLCRTHHKLVDDQPETHTAELLLTIKLNHERWVESKLKEAGAPAPLRIRRFDNEIPSSLKQVVSGQELLNLASNCHGSYQIYPDDLKGGEVDEVGGFLQTLKNWIDLAGDLESIERVRASHTLKEELEALERRGFNVFAASERQRLEGGVGSPSDFFILHVTLARAGDPGIVRPGSKPDMGASDLPSAQAAHSGK